MQTLFINKITKEQATILKREKKAGVPMAKKKGKKSSKKKVSARVIPAPKAAPKRKHPKRSKAKKPAIKSAPKVALVKKVKKVKHSGQKGRKPMHLGAKHRPVIYKEGNRFKRSPYSHFGMPGIPVTVNKGHYHKPKHKGSKKYSSMKGAKHFMKNPLTHMKDGFKDTMSAIPEALMAGAGLYGTNAVINVMPVGIRFNAPVRLAVKAGVVLVGAIGARMINKKAGEAVALGGMINILQDSVETFKLDAMLPIIRDQNFILNPATGEAADIPAAMLYDSKGAGMIVSDKQVNDLFAGGDII
jgi:hypothetical protein